MTATLPSESSTGPGAPTARRVGVFGLGRTGLACAMAVAGQPGLTLAGFVETNRALRSFARGAGFLQPAAPTLARLLAIQPLDALIVSAVEGGAVSRIGAALESGLPVLVEGLPAGGAGGAASLRERIAALDSRMYWGSAPLFHPLFVRAGRLVAAGALGAPKLVRASAFVSRVFAGDTPPARGDVFDFAVVDALALLDSLFGPARTVSASAHQLYGQRYDEAHGTLRLASGLEVAFDASWSVPGYPRAAQVVEVEGDLGTLIVSDDALEATLSRPCDDFPAGVTRRVLADEPDPLPFDAGDISRLVAAFAQALAGHRVLALEGARGLRIVGAIDGMRRSAAAGGGWVELEA